MQSMTKVAIIGGGLAGTACAHVLARSGAEPVIYEAGPVLAGGASGNDLGLYNPRLAAERTPESEFYISAFAQAHATFKSLDGVDWTPCGALHLITDEKREKRYMQMVENWGWGKAHMRILSAAEASAAAGVTLAHDALYLPESGAVSPRKLCDVYVCGVEVRLNNRIERLEDLEEDVVIVANGTGALAFDETSWLKLQAVRGQITHVKPTAYSGRLKTALCYGGYCAPAVNGAHIVGSTFQRWLDHSETMPEDDTDNLAKLAAVAPDLADGFEVTGHRAAVRTASKDHFPVAGAVPGHDNLYVSAGHGSHGILSTLAAAHLLADMILGRPRSLPVHTIERLAPQRYYERP